MGHLIKPASFKFTETVPFKGKIIITTFGLISGAGIRAALDALLKKYSSFPKCCINHLGKTTSQVSENDDGNRVFTKKVKELKIQKTHSLSINTFL
jgi:hypothetical protein